MNTNIALNSLGYSLPEDLRRAVSDSLADWEKDNKIARLWQKDAALWANEDEAKWLGWLDIVDRQLSDKQKFADFQREVQAAGFTHILLMGMGGSSLCPEVLAFTFGQQEGFPKFHILDSVNPAQIKAVEAKIDLSKTLFFVSSKSGSTLEPNIFKQYFFERVATVVGKENAGKQFVAITDPGSKMQKVAEVDKFWRIFYGDPAIGGRFSALSDFGMIPLAAMGLDVGEFLDRAAQIVYACKNHNAKDNPGVLLGAILGTAHQNGRDKLTIITSPKIYDLGAWLEQLIAESTGKKGVSIIPVDREKIEPPENYGNDRVFVYLKFKQGEVDVQKSIAIGELERAGHPLITIEVDSFYNLGQEFFRWEIATAVAGSIMKINTFNQPDVEFSKVETRKLTDEYEKTGHLPDEKPFFEGDGIKLFTDEKNLGELDKIVGAEKSLAGYLKAHLSRIKTDDYFALLAYLQMDTENENVLKEIREFVLDTKHVATCLGFGPRFLHSTGQAYKGGANNGVFLQVTSDDATDLDVPDQKFTFGVVKAAQARGDFQVLVDRDRRALRVHLSAEVIDGLHNILEAIS